MANAAPSIPAAMASLQTYSNALAAFTAAWRALESETVALDSALASRLAGYSELELLCSSMDGAGLRAHLTDHRVELEEPARALDPALLVAPDAGLLVLSAATGFCRAPPEEIRTEGHENLPCRLLTCLLDRLRRIGVKPSLEAREEARAVAADWKRHNRVGTDVTFRKETFAFLLLVGVFGLVDEVGGAGEVLDLVVSITSWDRALDAFVGLGLDLDQHMPVLIEKMIHKGKQLEVVKFIQAHNLAHKNPFLPILRSYITSAALAGKMIRIRGSDLATQNAADAEECMLLGMLQKFIKEHGLEELPALEEANKRIAELERQTTKRAADIHEQEKLQQLMQSAKRLKPDNVVQGSSGQGVHPSGGSIRYQTALTQKPAATQIPQLLVGGHRPVAPHNQVPIAPIVRSHYGGFADLTSSRPCGSSSLAHGLSAQNVPSARTSSRSKLYLGDPLKAASQSSDNKSSSYRYSLSNMSTYDPK